MDPDDDWFAGEILWPDAHEQDTLVRPQVARADTESGKEEEKGAATRKSIRRGLQEEHDGSSLPPTGHGGGKVLPQKTKHTESMGTADQNSADSRVGATAVPGTAAETAAGDLEPGDGGTVSSLTHQSTGTNSGMQPVSWSIAPYHPGVGAHAVWGLGNETAEPGDDGTIVIGDGTHITESPETIVAEAVTQDTWSSEIRTQVRSEIQEETWAQILSQIVYAATVAIEGSSDEGATPPFWTPRKRVYVAGPIVMAVIVGIVVGILFATGTIAEDGGGGPSAFQRLEGLNDGDNFGSFVVFSSDSSTMAVGAKDGDYVQVFRWNRTQWAQIGETIYGETIHGDGGQFGRCLDLNQDGSVLAVGTWNSNEAGEKAGSAQVFQYNDSKWDQFGQTFLGNASEDRFGWYVSLSFDGRTIAVSGRLGDPAPDRVDAGYVRVFTYNETLQQSSGDWSQLGPNLEGEAFEDQFGRSTALSADGRRLAVGAVHGAEGKGRIHIFDYSEGLWIPVGQASLDGDAVDDWQGTSVDLSANGSIVAIGADGHDSHGNETGLVRVYSLNETGLWAQLGQNLLGEGFEDQFGSTQISLSDNGDCLAVGANHNGHDRGKGYLFQWSNSQWNEIASVTGDGTRDRLGSSATVSGNCSWYAFGSPLSPHGYVHIYQVG